MFAVVDILGQQFKVEENKKYYVPKLKEETDTNVVFENVLLYSNDEGTKVGSPKVSGVKVVARVLQHLKDEKVLVFKKKRRTGYDKRTGTGSS